MDSLWSAQCMTHDLDELPFCSNILYNHLAHANTMNSWTPNALATPTKPQMTLQFWQAGSIFFSKCGKVSKIPRTFARCSVKRFIGLGGLADDHIIHGMWYAKQYAVCSMHPATVETLLDTVSWEQYLCDVRQIKYKSNNIQHTMCHTDTHSQCILKG